jgi:CheY-like chemotaxis protein
VLAYNKAFMPKVLLVGMDWSWRSLLRAQLVEEGIDVKAYETSRDALNTVTNLTDLPKLLVADLHDSRRPEAEVDLLSKWSSLIPVWLITSRASRVDRELGDAGIERVLARPVDVRRLLEEIKQRVGSN